MSRLLIVLVPPFSPTPPPFDSDNDNKLSTKNNEEDQREEPTIQEVRFLKRTEATERKKERETMRVVGGSDQ